MHIIIGLSKRERAQYYSNVVSFVDKLIDIGEQLILVPDDQRSTDPFLWNAHDNFFFSLLFLVTHLVIFFSFRQRSDSSGISSISASTWWMASTSPSAARRTRITASFDCCRRSPYPCTPRPG